MPMVLKGGYKDWMRKYPMFTTKVLDFDLMSNMKISTVVADLSGIFLSLLKLKFALM